jgi:tRNA threonylcarbamoyladenosine biosynthesis protein TsaB
MIISRDEYEMVTRPTILALDSSSENCSVAVYHQQVISLNSEHAPRKHTQLMLPLLKQELANRELALTDVNAIAFGCGPGSFTGIRIAAGVAQGLAFGLDIPIYAISNLKALALQSYLEHGVDSVLVSIDARMSEVYWAVFEVSEEDILGQDSDNKNQSFKRYTIKTLIDEQVTPPETILLSNIISRIKSAETLSGIGSGIDLLADDLIAALKHKDTSAQPNADTIAYLAEKAIASGLKGDIKDALPSYVRDSITWNKLPGR